jgi:hypothetical protein
MSDPPPTPVIPTNRPLTNPQIEYSGPIAYMAGFPPLGDVANGARERFNLKTAKLPGPTFYTI